MGKIAELINNEEFKTTLKDACKKEGVTLENSDIERLLNEIDEKVNSELSEEELNQISGGYRGETKEKIKRIIDATVTTIGALVGGIGGARLAKKAGVESAITSGATGAASVIGGGIISYLISDVITSEIFKDKKK